ncbi:SBBP repeat-containing protein [Vicingaceae bacterium]|nr:SBBP repeat-containing protein [Vicingaceae bacterium]
MIQKLLLLLIMINLYAAGFAKENNLSNKSKSQYFIENKGQWPSNVFYSLKIGGVDVWITKQGVVYDFYQLKEPKIEENEKYSDSKLVENYNRFGHVVEVNHYNKNANPKPIGKYKQPAYYNYFLGNDSTKWASFVGLYKEVIIEDVFEGINQRFYFDNNMLRYDYIVEPEANYDDIQLIIDGANDYHVNKLDELVYTTRFGEVKQMELEVYQTINGGRKKITSNWNINKNKIGFLLGEYDKNLPLIIDPLVYSTFIGGGNSDAIFSLKTDSIGNVYITGYCSSSSFPTTIGAYDEIENGDTEIFVAKLNATGSNLFYSTYIGGNSSEGGAELDIDNQGNVYVTGQTNSSNFPVTLGAFDQTYKGTDGYISKLNASGSALIYSTYLGGTTTDNCQSIVVDNFGNAYVTGDAGFNFPTTIGAFDVSHNGVQDVHITKLNASGSALIYSTYIGGPLYITAKDIAIDGGGNAYITGYSDPGYLITPGVYGETIDGSGVIITKINADGTNLIYSTVIGGSGFETGMSIAIDDNDNIYIAGQTTSTDFPTSIGAYDSTYNGGLKDGFVLSVNISGGGLNFSTFIGGSNTENVNDIKVDTNYNSYITGGTKSTNFPVTIGSYDDSHNGNEDVFLSKINALGTQMEYSTFLGSTSTDRGYEIDLNEDIYIGGYTGGNGYPITPGVYDTSHNGNADGFVTKLNICNTSSSTSITACESYISPSGNYSWNSSNIYVDTIPNSYGCDSIMTINLTINNNSFSIINESACLSYVSPSGNNIWTTTNTYFDTIPNSEGCDSLITINLTIYNNSSFIMADTVCTNYTSPSGIYSWTNSGTYFDTIANSIGCDSLLTINLIVNPNDDFCIVISDSLKFIVPNVFSPNNDGHNDNFSIEVAGGNLINQINIRIFNRWGQEFRAVTFTNSELKQRESKRLIIWDGRTSSGKEVAEGTYFYVLEYLLENGEQNLLKGSVSLLK